MDEIEAGSGYNPPESTLTKSVDGLFKAAAAITDKDDRPCFTVGSQARPSGPAVRDVFIGRTQYSFWKNATWPEDSRGSQLKFTETFIEIFSERNLGNHIRPGYSVADANQIYPFWDVHCRDLLADTVSMLEKYADYLRQWQRQRMVQQALAMPGDRSRVSDTHAETVERSEQNPSEQILNADHIFDLEPPPNEPQIQREEILSELSALSKRFFLVAVEGVSGSGKTYLLNTFVRSQTPSAHQSVVWYTPTSGSGLNDLFDVLSTHIPHASSDDASRLRALFHWLTATRSILVIDDFQRVDMKSYTPLIQLALRYAGPARILLASSKRVIGEFHELPALGLGGVFKGRSKAVHASACR